MVAQKKRNPWVTGLVIAAAVLIFGCIILLVGGAYWWNANGAQVGAEIQTARRDGEAAALGNDYQGCLNQAAESIEGRPRPMALFVGNSFLGGCMEKAAEPPGFCDVPSDVLGMRIWRQQRCEAARPDARDSCALLIGTVQQICKERRKPKS